MRQFRELNEECKQHWFKDFKFSGKDVVARKELRLLSYNSDYETVNIPRKLINFST